MSKFTRRSFVQALTAGAAVASALGMDTALAQAQTATIPDAFAAQLQPKALTFDPAQLDGLSERLITSHWQNNYGGSVNALNTIKQRLRNALAEDDIPAFVYNDLKREHLMRTGSVVLHEYYFNNMAPPGARDTELDAHLRQAFGSVATWEREFRRIAAGLGGGSGWTMLAWNFHNETLENYWMADHMHVPAASIPVLVLDMYEHSYHIDYGAAAAQYIDAFMRNVNWQVVAGRLGAALQRRV